MRSENRKFLNFRHFAAVVDIVLYIVVWERSGRDSEDFSCFSMEKRVETRSEEHMWYKNAEKLSQNTRGTYPDHQDAATAAHGRPRARNPLDPPTLSRFRSLKEVPTVVAELC